MLEWLKNILGDTYTEEVDKQVSAEIGKNFVSRSDFNNLNTTKKQLEGQISERDRQLEELRKVDTTYLQNEITRLQGENQKAKEKFDSDLNALKLDSALDAAITAAGGRNTKAIKALLKTDGLKLKDDGSLEGLDLEAVKKSDGYLFATQTPPPFANGSGNDKLDDEVTKETFGKMGYRERLELKTKNPELYKQFKEE